jgi:hypothetical protein
MGTEGLAMASGGEHRPLQYSPNRSAGVLPPTLVSGSIAILDAYRCTRMRRWVERSNDTETSAHRADGSGTTFNWVNYLSKVSPEWKDKVGEGTAVEWPTGLGGKGNEGVAAFVKQMKNSIGYVEYAYVLQNKITYGLVQNKAGKFIKPDSASFQAAAASANWGDAEDLSGRRNGVNHHV